MAADNDTLGLIHKALAEQFLDILTNGIPVEKADGEGNVTTTIRKPTAAEYRCGFLPRSGAMAGWLSFPAC